MTPKERARLRGLANGIDTVLQIGKDGIGDTLIHQADITLEARELIKGRVLDSCMDYTPRTAAEALAAATNSEVVQVIGSKFVLYRKRKKAAPTGNQARKKAAPTGNQARKGKPSGNRPRKAEAFQGGGRKSREFGERKPRDNARKSRDGARNPRNSDAHGERKPHGGARNPRNSDASGQRKSRDSARSPRNADASGQRKPRNTNASRKANPRNGGTFGQRNGTRPDRKTRK